MPTLREALVILNLIPGLGPVRIRSLLDCCGSPEIILHSPREFLKRLPGIGDRLAEAIASWRECTSFQAELEMAERMDVRITTVLDDDYPEALRQLYDPPPVLYSRGQWSQSDAEKSVAIVGTRQMTAYGCTVARQFGRELAEAGCTIVSGLATGIDTAGHWGALDAGGRTIAVLGSGFNAFFPEENRELADRIASGFGAIVSEFPLNVRPSKTTFPRRNRLVAAWSKAILVVEAPHRSGSLHTARLGAEMGCNVFAVPGPINRTSSEGCHELLRDGATLAASSAHLLSDMKWGTQDPPIQGNLDFSAPAISAIGTLDSEERLILDAIEQGHRSLDLLCPATGMNAMEISTRLARLQIMRIISPLPGGRFEIRK